MKTKTLLIGIMAIMMILLVASSVVSLTTQEKRRINNLAEKHNTTPQAVMERLGITDDTGNSNNNENDNSDTSNTGSTTSFDSPAIVDDTGNNDNTDTVDDTPNTENNQTTIDTDDKNEDNSTNTDDIPDVIVDTKPVDDDTDDETDEKTREERREERIEILRGIIGDDTATKQDVNALTTEEIRAYRKSLAVSDGHEIKLAVAKKLIVTKRENTRQYNAIVRITREVYEDAEKEILAGDLADMDDSFVEEFQQKLNDRDSGEQVKEQVQQYVEEIQEDKPIIKKTFDTTDVAQILNKEKSYDDLVKELFG